MHLAVEINLFDISHTKYTIYQLICRYDLTIVAEDNGSPKKSSEFPFTVRVSGQIVEVSLAEQVGIEIVNVAINETLLEEALVDETPVVSVLPTEGAHLKTTDATTIEINDTSNIETNDTTINETSNATTVDYNQTSSSTNEMEKSSTPGKSLSKN